MTLFIKIKLQKITKNYFYDILKFKIFLINIDKFIIIMNLGKM